MIDFQTEFDKQNDELLEFIILNKHFFEGNKKKSKIELYITSECNQECEYCYLVKYGDELYPKELRNREIILHNLNILLKFLLDKNIQLEELDIFSGEILGTEFCDKIINTILDYINKGLSIKSILVPSNCSFLLDEKQTESVKNYYKLFKGTKTIFHISASVDGKIIESQSRSFKDKKKNELRDDRFYAKFFDMVKTYNMGLHPMISAHSIDKWIENLDWWDDALKSIGKDASYLMTLEVRNDEWDLDHILMFLKFLNYCCDKFIVEYGVENYAEDAIMHFRKQYDSYRLERLGVRDGNIPTCSISDFLIIRLGDLSIVPCHRLSYDKLIYGKFKVENDEIVGIKSNNVQMANKILLGSCKTTLNCGTCVFNRTCTRGCLGCQYEINKDPFIVCDTVCDLQKAKVCFLIDKYKKIGLLKYLKTHCSDYRIVTVLEDAEKIVRTKEYEKWHRINQTML